jgi:hypothetical protein
MLMRSTAALTAEMMRATPGKLLDIASSKSRALGVVEITGWKGLDAGILSRSMRLGSSSTATVSGAGCQEATLRGGATAARCVIVSELRGKASALRRPDLSGPAGRRELAAANGVLAITLISGSVIWLSSAETARGIASAVKLAAARTPEYLRGTRNLVSAGTANLTTHTQRLLCREPGRFGFVARITKP